MTSSPSTSQESTFEAVRRQQEELRLRVAKLLIPGAKVAAVESPPEPPPDVTRPRMKQFYEKASDGGCPCDGSPCWPSRQDSGVTGARRVPSDEAAKAETPQYTTAIPVRKADAEVQTAMRLLQTDRDVIWTASNLSPVVDIKQDDDDEKERHDFTGVTDVEYMDDAIRSGDQRFKSGSSECTSNQLAESADAAEASIQPSYVVELVNEHNIKHKPLNFEIHHRPDVWNLITFVERSKENLNNHNMMMMTMVIMIMKTNIIEQRIEEC